MNAGMYPGMNSGIRFVSETRIGDAERDAAVSSLGEHFAAGRLTHEEYDERSDLALQARTTSDLKRLFVDLPATANVRSGPVKRWQRLGQPGAGAPWLRLLVVLLAVIAIAQIPAWPLLILAWLWFFGPLRRLRGQHHPW